MAELENITTHPITVLELAAGRSAIITAAEADNGRDLTDAEQEQVDLYGSLIVGIPAQSIADAAVQVYIALEQVELAWDNVGTEDGLDVAYAALRSAQAVLAKAA